MPGGVTVAKLFDLGVPFTFPSVYASEKPTRIMLRDQLHHLGKFRNQRAACHSCARHALEIQDLENTGDLYCDLRRSIVRF